MQRPSNPVTENTLRRQLAAAQKARQVRQSAHHAVEALEGRLLLSAALAQSKILHPVGNLAPATHSIAPKKAAIDPSLIKAPKSKTVVPLGIVNSDISTDSGSATPPSADKTPAQLRGAYGLGQYGSSSFTFNGAQATGAGQTIAIIDAYDDPNAASDLHNFDVAMGLPDPPSFTKVNQYGDENNLPGTDPAGQWELEESLDIEYAHAMAPLANIILVEVAYPSFYDLVQLGVDWARHAPGVSVVSMSFGEGELDVGPSNEALYDSYLTTPSGHQGVTFIAATGDRGAYDPSSYTVDPSYPAISPNVVAAGGSSLTLTNSNTGLGWSSESGWENSGTSGFTTGGGGGISNYETQPSFQHGSFNTFSSTMRTIPDVSAEADPNAPGVALYDSYNFGASTPWLSSAEGGTSLSAPLWAGLVAVANQGRAANLQPSFDGASELLPALYSLRTSTTDFHDITTGTSNGQAYYTSKPGYDLVTGIGSPIASGLIPALVNSAAVPVITSFTVSPSIQSSGSAGQTLSVAVSSSSPVTEVDYYLEYNGVQNSVLPGLQTSGDMLLAAVTNSAGGYAHTVAPYTGFANGTYIYYAVAKNANGSSESVIADSTFTAGTGAAPSVGSLTGPTQPVLTGAAVELVASNITDSTGTPQYVSFWQESNGIPGLQVGPGGDTPIAVTSVSSSGSWDGNAIAPTPGTYVYYAQTTDYNLNNGYPIISSQDGTSAKSIAVTVVSGTASVSSTVSISGGGTTAVPGQSITFIATIKNDGASAANGVSVSEIIPPSIVSTLYTTSDNGLGANGYTATGTGSINDTVNLPAGASITYLISATINSSATGPLSLSVTATTPASTANAEVNVAGSFFANQGSAGVSLTPQVQLGIAMNGADPLTVGEQDVYTLVITNFQTTASGSDAISATVNTNPLSEFTGIHYAGSILYAPDNAATPTIASSTGSIANGSAFNDTFSLSAGSIIEFTVTGTVAPGASGTISNTATVSLPGVDVNTSDASSSVTAAVVNGPSGSVLGRGVFYDNSFWDTPTTTNPGFSQSPDTAVPTDKLALMPGQTARFNNYTSYTNGLNGAYIDITGDTNHTISASDFNFMVGNNSSPGTWSAAPTPTGITLFPGAGVNGSDRVQITWANDAIMDQWLQITVLANQADTNLGSPDVFYFGNAPGDVGNSVTDAFVTSADDIAARNDIHTTRSDPATLENPHDFNRDSRVDASDEIYARNHHTDRSTGLALISV